MIMLDPTTLRFCSNLARAAAVGANGLPNKRAHHDVASAALNVLADEFEALASTHEVRPARPQRPVVDEIPEETTS